MERPVRVVHAERAVLELRTRDLGVGRDRAAEALEFGEEPLQHRRRLARLGPDAEPVEHDRLHADAVEELAQLRSAQAVERGAHEAPLAPDALHERVRVEGVREVAALAARSEQLAARRRRPLDDKSAPAEPARADAGDAARRAAAEDRDVGGGVGARKELPSRS